MSFHIYISVLFISLGVGIVSNKFLPQGLKYLLWLVALTIPVEVSAAYLQSIHKKAQWIFYLYQPFEYALITGYFLHILVSPVQRRIIFLVLPLILGINLFNIFAFQGLNNFNTYVFLTSAALVSIWSIFFFFQSFQILTEDSLINNPNFWICNGILFFYAGTFFQMGFTNIIFSYNPEIAKKLYIINHLLNCILYGMITYGFICQAKYLRA